jgi:uncharacterized RDD family membrane protein YckC
MLKCAGAMDRKPRRIDISTRQPELDFEEAEHTLPFTMTDYQRDLLPARFAAELTDFGIAAGVYVIFLLATLSQMPEGVPFDKRVAGIYVAGFFVLAGVYFLLFMLSASQTPGMKMRNLVAVNRDGHLLGPTAAAMRGFGYFISIMPVMLGFIWAIVDPEHLGWADKVSGTYLKKV